MNLSKIFDNHKEKRPSIVTIGTFDGMHIGHISLIKDMKELADKIIPIVISLYYTHLTLPTNREV